MEAALIKNNKYACVNRQSVTHECYLLVCIFHFIPNIILVKHAYMYTLFSSLFNGINSLLHRVKFVSIFSLIKHNFRIFSIALPSNNLASFIVRYGHSAMCHHTNNSTRELYMYTYTVHFHDD